jgi:hypothetical protein
VRIPTWVWVLLGIMLLGGGAKVYTMTRGLRNNNPGNIKEGPNSSTLWVGERATDDDSIFEEFVTMEHGIRAATVLFRNYQKLYGLSTIAQLISRWAPGNENDTANYIRFVSERLHVPPNVPIDLTSPIIVPFLRSVFQMENGPGAAVISDAQMQRGISLA